MRQLGHDPLVGVQVIAVCGLCGREVEVVPLDRDLSFEDLCDACAYGITARNGRFTMKDLNMKEKQGLLQAGEVALALLEINKEDQ